MQHKIQPITEQFLLLLSSLFSLFSYTQHDYCRFSLPLSSASVVQVRSQYFSNTHLFTETKMYICPFASLRSAIHLFTQPRSQHFFFALLCYTCSCYDNLACSFSLAEHRIGFSKKKILHLLLFLLSSLFSLFSYTQHEYCRSPLLYM